MIKFLVLSLTTASSLFPIPTLLLVQFDALGNFVRVLRLTDRFLHHLILLFDSFLEQSLSDTIEGILDAFTVDRCRFLVRDLSLRSTPLHNLTRLDLPFTLQVLLVPEDEEGEILRVLGHALFKEVIAPGLQVLEAFEISYVTDEYARFSASVKSGPKRLVPFLTCRVP